MDLLAKAETSFSLEINRETSGEKQISRKYFDRMAHSVERDSLVFLRVEAKADKRNSLIYDFYHINPNPKITFFENSVVLAVKSFLSAVNNRFHSEALTFEKFHFLPLR